MDYPQKNRLTTEIKEKPPTKDPYAYFRIMVSAKIPQNGSQDIVMKAAALNVKGICAMELNQEAAAKDNFAKALELAPEFVLAKGNLDNLNKKQTAPANKTPSSSVKSTTAPK